jgi:hypothetical protein
VATFLVVLRRSGPQWDPALPLEEQPDFAAHAAFVDGLVDAGFIVLGGPLADEHRVVYAVEAETEDAVRATLARDPWDQTHLEVDSIDPWTVRLDGRRAGPAIGTTVDASGRAYIDLATASGGEIRDSVALDDIDEADRVPALGSIVLHFDFYGRLAGIEATDSAASVLPPAVLDAAERS